MALTKEQAQAAIEKEGSQLKAARALGVSKKAVWNALRRDAGKVPAKDKAKPSSGQQARTLEDFRRDHDQTWKIRDGLKRLFCGGTILTDCEFRDAVGGNPSRWRAAAESSEFREFRYRVSGELLWASKQTIREMRRIRGEAV